MFNYIIILFTLIIIFNLIVIIKLNLSNKYSKIIFFKLQKNIIISGFILRFICINIIYNPLFEFLRKHFVINYNIYYQNWLEFILFNSKNSINQFNNDNGDFFYKVVLQSIEYDELNVTCLFFIHSSFYEFFIMINILGFLIKFIKDDLYKIYLFIYLYIKQYSIKFSNYLFYNYLRNFNFIFLRLYKYLKNTVDSTSANYKISNTLSKILINNDSEKLSLLNSLNINEHQLIKVVLFYFCCFYFLFFYLQIYIFETLYVSFLLLPHYISMLLYLIRFMEKNLFLHFNSREKNSFGNRRFFISYPQLYILIHELSMLIIVNILFLLLLIFICYYIYMFFINILNY
uniref:Uncharacterized protein orf344 n=1 Tax=Cyanophora paradoxa TaxID=2762 RepID=E9P1F9_CYAPA|nr:hypothetical protein CYPAM_p42 [Cyanophora paradoxa]ADW79211.1 hypothetical protein [Cyanophora paradoxa]